MRSGLQEFFGRFSTARQIACPPSRRDPPATLLRPVPPAGSPPTRSLCSLAGASLEAAPAANAPAVPPCVPRRLREHPRLVWKPAQPRASVFHPTLRMLLPPGLQSAAPLRHFSPVSGVLSPTNRVASPRKNNLPRCTPPSFRESARALLPRPSPTRADARRTASHFEIDAKAFFAQNRKMPLFF